MLIQCTSQNILFGNAKENLNKISVQNESSFPVDLLQTILDQKKNCYYFCILMQLIDISRLVISWLSFLDRQGKINWDKTK